MACNSHVLIGDEEISVINENYKRSKAEDINDDDMEPEGQGTGEGTSTTPGPTTGGAGAAEGAGSSTTPDMHDAASLHRILRRSSRYLRTRVPLTRSLPWRTTTTSA